MTKKEMLDQLQGPGSVDYTFMPVSKVIEMLNELEETPSASALTKEDIRELAESIAESLSNEGTALIQDYDLSMNYKEVELDGVEFDDSKMADEAEIVIKNFFDERGERDQD